MLVAAAGCAHGPSASVLGRSLPAGLGPPPVLDAHDGSVVQDGATFWIFGTSYACGFGLNRVGTRWCGINAFSSADLQTWTPQGQPVAPDALWQQRCAPPRFGCFRPHVARSAATGQWVMWINTYDIPAGYRVLTAPSPAGPWTETATPTLALGGRTLPSRGDQDVFVDSAGVGWIAYTLLERNVPADVAVERLNPELTSGTGEVVRVPLGFVEAPSLFERNGKFLMTFSDPACPYCGAATGLASASSPLGPWVEAPTLSARSCDGQPAEVSYLRLADGPIWLYVSDRWVRGDPNQERARIWWEPLAFRENGLPVPPRCTAVFY
jgi:beta-xylosidase